MDILIALWTGARNIASTVIANWEAFTTLTILAIPSIGLRLLKRKS